MWYEEIMFHQLESEGWSLGPDLKEAHYIVLGIQILKSDSSLIPDFPTF